MANRDLVVRFIGDDRDLRRALMNTEKRVATVDTRMASFGKNVTRAFGAAGIAVGTRAAFEGFEKAVGSASALNEQLARSNQIFDENARSVEAWSETMASSFGIAQSQALEFAGTFGLLFRNLGSSAPEAEKFSRQLVQLAADLASFNNTDVDVALAALRSGLTGEIEPLRKFGVFLSEARAQQQALADTGKATASALTTQDKVLARLNIIMADTVRAQGDFARTSDSLANMQRKAAAESENLAANLGKALAPAMEIALVSTIALTRGLNDLIAGMGDLRAALRESDFFDGFNAAIEEANERATGFFANLRDNIPLLNEVARLREGVIGGGTSFAIPSRPEEGRGALDAAAGQAKELEQNATKATRNQVRARKAFDEFIKGLGLKLDRARITRSGADDLAVLREIERAIQRRIRAEGRTFKLVDQLTQVQLQIASEIGDSQATAQDKETDAIERKLDRQERADERRRARLQKRQARRERNQFRDLGLTDGGDTRTPGRDALRNRLASVRKQVEGTVLDTDKTEAQLDGIAKALSNKYKEVGKNVRQAILEMLNDITSALESGGKTVERSGGEITKGGIRSTQRLLRGVEGLTEEQRRQIQANNLGVSGRRGLSAFGVGIGQGGITTGSIDRQGTGGFVIHNLTVVSNDPNDMMKKLQKKGRRTSGGRRGRHGGANLGLQ